MGHEWDIIIFSIRWLTAAQLIVEALGCLWWLLPWLLLLTVVGVPVWLWVSRRNRRQQVASTASAAGSDDVRGADTRL